MSEFNLKKAIEDSIKKAAQEIGVVNVYIAGKSGVGKSTLINAVFQGNIADTGQGKPVTKETKTYTKEGIPVTITDTRGLELKEYKKNFELIESYVKTLQSKDVKEHMHIAWLCISEDSRRVEDAEIELCEMLSKYMPVLAIITKAARDEGFKNKVKELLPKAKNVVRVRSLDMEFDDGGVILPVLGLKDLVDATIEVIPEGQKKAFAASQKVSFELKRKHAHYIVAGAATAAAAAAAIPIPFSDAAVIVPIQIGMLAGISAVFGLNVSEGFLATLVSSTITGVLATVAGRTIVSNLFKLIPGIGSLVGGAVGASTAALVTTAFGEAYIYTLNEIYEKNPEQNVSPEKIAEKFKEALKNPKKS